MENVVLWYECDISYFLVECGIGFDIMIMLDFVLNCLVGVIEKLVVYLENMLKNMNKFKGLVMLQWVLLVLMQVGVLCEDVYCLVQCNVMKVWEQGVDFKIEFLVDVEVIVVLLFVQIEEKFDFGYYIKYVDMIFVWVFGENGVY